MDQIFNKTLIVGIAVILVIIYYIFNTIRKYKDKEKPLIGDIISFVIPLILIYIIFYVVLLPTIIASGSMEPALMTGDIAVYNKMAYVSNNIERGDIVIFYSPEEKVYLGKRIIGLPNDKISFKDGYTVINGIRVDESLYIDDKIETNCIKTFKVPNDCYFVMGDNRENSFDSRFFENPYISRDLIKGKYIGGIPLHKIKKFIISLNVYFAKLYVCHES